MNKPPAAVTRPGRAPDTGRGDPSALLRGAGCFTGDVAILDALHIAFLRSPVAGRITALDTGAARGMPGIAAVHVGADVAGLGRLSVNPVLPLAADLPGFPLLAGARADAAGQAIAAVLAESPHAAQDAAEAIAFEIDEDAAPPPQRTLARNRWQAGDTAAAFAGADIVVDCTLRHARLAPTPLEPRAIAAAYDPATGGVTVWHSTQTPHRTRSELAAILGAEATRIRVIAPDVGGAFGMKASLYPEEAFCVWAAFHHRRSTRWQATRSEEFLSASQGRGITSRGRLALTATGRFLALEAEIDAPLGHWLPSSALIPAWNAGRILPGGYVIRAIDVTTRAVQRGGTATGIYRGAGRPEAACLMERLADKAARAAGIDPLALRQANLLPATALPHETATGNLLDSGDYEAALRLLAERADYAGALADRDASRAAGGLAGVGIGFYLEPSGSGWETARVTLGADGTARVAGGGSAQGQPRAAFARIAAEALGIDAARVSVHWGDSATCPEGIGALASRSTAIGGSAVLRACEEVRARRDAGEALPLTAETRYETEGQAWGYGAYLAALTIDRETGRIRLGQLTCVDDTGRMIDPEGVKGQIRGGAAQGLGEALMERLVHDGEGQLLTGSLMDYALPRAADMPPVDIHTTETPSPMNALGAKGVGEAGTIGAPAAILNAAADALAPLGIDDLDMPLTSHRIWRAIREAERTGDR